MENSCHTHTTHTHTHTHTYIKENHCRTRWQCYPERGTTVTLGDCVIHLFVVTTRKQPTKKVKFIPKGMPLPWPTKACTNMLMVKPGWGQTGPSLDFVMALLWQYGSIHWTLVYDTHTEQDVELLRTTICPDQCYNQCLMKPLLLLGN